MAGDFIPYYPAYVLLPDISTDGVLKPDKGALLRLFPVLNACVYLYGCFDQSLIFIQHLLICDTSTSRGLYQRWLYGSNQP